MNAAHAPHGFRRQVMAVQVKRASRMSMAVVAALLMVAGVGCGPPEEGEELLDSATSQQGEALSDYAFGGANPRGTPGRGTGLGVLPPGVAVADSQDPIPVKPDPLPQGGSGGGNPGPLPSSTGGCGGDPVERINRNFR